MERNFINSLYEIANNRISVANLNEDSSIKSFIKAKIGYAEKTLNGFYSGANAEELNIKTKIRELEARTNTLILVDVYITIAKKGYGDEHNSREFKAAMNRLCPLWPFC